MSPPKIFFWSAIAVAGLTFAGALAAGAAWATKFRASGTDDDRFEELRDEAIEKLESGDVGSARRLTERVLAIDPEDPFARANLGRIYKGQGDYARAIAEHKLALVVAPDLPDLYYNIACYYALLKRKDDALEWLAAAFAHGFGRRASLASDPDLASLRGDERFDLLARTGKLPTGIPRIRVHSARRAKRGQPFEVSVVIEREVPPASAVEAAASMVVTFAPEAPLEIVSQDLQTKATQMDGMVSLKTIGRYRVKGTRDGIFTLSPVKVEAAGKVVESHAGVVQIGAEEEPEDVELRELEKEDAKRRQEREGEP